MERFPDAAVLPVAAGVYLIFASALMWLVLRRDVRLAARGWQPVPVATLYGLAALGGAAALAVANLRFFGTVRGRPFRFWVNMIVAAQLFGAASLVMPQAEMAARLHAAVPKTIVIGNPAEKGGRTIEMGRIFDEHDPTRADGIRSIRMVASSGDRPMPKRFGPGAAD